MQENVKTLYNLQYTAFLFNLKKYIYISWYHKNKFEFYLFITFYF